MSDDATFWAILAAFAAGWLCGAALAWAVMST